MHKKMDSPEIKWCIGKKTVLCKCSLKLASVTYSLCFMVSLFRFLGHFSFFSLLCTICALGDFITFFMTAVKYNFISYNIISIHFVVRKNNPIFFCVIFQFVIGETVASDRCLFQMVHISWPLCFIFKVWQKRKRTKLWPFTTKFEAKLQLRATCRLWYVYIWKFNKQDNWYDL